KPTPDNPSTAGLGNEPEHDRDGKRGVPQPALQWLDARRLLPPLRHGDFRVKLEQVDLSPDATGLLIVPLTRKGYFRIETSEDAYVGLWTIDPKGDILQLYPNDTEKNHFFKAGQARIIPETSRPIEATVVSNGVEVLRVVASSVPWDPQKG